MELDHGGQRYPLAGRELVIGSEAPADVILPGLLPRHAALKPLGQRMATIRPLTEGAEIAVNGIPMGREPMPVLHGDLVRVGTHDLRLVNPAHPPGTPGTPPPGARQQLHDTFFGIRKEDLAAVGAPVDERSEAPAPAPRPEVPAPPGTRSSLLWIFAAALVALALIVVFLIL